MLQDSCPRFTTKLVLEFLREQPQFIDFIKQKVISDPDTTAVDRYNRPIIEVIPYDQRYGVEDIYCVDEQDLVLTDSWLVDTDLVEGDVELLGLRPDVIFSDIIKVIPYSQRHGAETVYFTSKLDLIEVDPDTAGRALCKAIKNGDSRRAIYLLSAIETCDFSHAEDSRGTTAIQCAVAASNEMFETVLLNMLSQDISSKDDRGNTVLHSIAMSGNTAALQSLIKIMPELMRSDDCYSLPNTANKQNQLPLCSAIINNKNEMAEALITYADLSKLGDCSLHNNQSLLHRAICDQNDTLIELLFSNQVLIEKLIVAVDDNNQTPLHFAAWYSDYDTFKRVYDASVTAGNILAASDEGYTVLHFMVQRCISANICRFIQDPSFDSRLVSAIDRYGQNALFWAASKGLVEVCELLIPICAELGCLTAQTPDGRTALVVAIQGELTEDRNTSCTGKHMLIVDLLINSSEGDRLINIDDEEGCTPLGHAVYTGGVQSCKVLYARTNSSQLCKQLKKYGYTVLHGAVIYRSVEMVEVLLSDTTKIRDMLAVCDLEGKTALQHAEERSPEMYECVLKAYQFFES